MINVRGVARAAVVGRITWEIPAQGELPRGAGVSTASNQRNTNMKRLSLAILVLSGVTLGLGAPGAQAALLHEYRCDENGGNTVFDAVGGLNGTTGPDTLLTGSYCQFNLSDNSYNDQSYINWGTGIGQFGTADFGVSFNMRTTSTNNNNDLIGNRADGSGGNFFSVRMGAGVVGAEIDEDVSNTNYIALNSTTRVDDGLWHNVFVARIGNTLSLSVDGVLEGSGSSSGAANIANGVPFQAGFSPISTLYGLSYTGDMSDIKIFDSVPEPATLSLLALGAMALCRRRIAGPARNASPRVK